MRQYRDPYERKPALAGAYRDASVRWQPKRRHVITRLALNLFGATCFLLIMAGVFIAFGAPTP